jgi:hypothetical protein
MVGDVWEETGRVAIGDSDSQWAVGDSGQVEGGSDYIEESKASWWQQLLDFFFFFFFLENVIYLLKF